MPQPLTDQSRRFLEEQRFAVLSTLNPDGTPQQSTVWYEVQGDEIMMNTKRGRLKDRNLRRDPRCSVCVEDGYTYVAIRGTVRLIDDQETTQADVRRLAILNHGPEKAERQMAGQFNNEERVTIRLTMERISEYGVEE
ncbi:MAG: PPOX class F420-dependent oxidoreductase [Chloroflexota bacterium]